MRFGAKWNVLENHHSPSNFVQHAMRCSFCALRICDLVSYIYRILQVVQIRCQRQCINPIARIIHDGDATLLTFIYHIDGATQRITAIAQNPPPDLVRAREHGPKKERASTSCWTDGFHLLLWAAKDRCGNPFASLRFRFIYFSFLFSSNPAET